MQLERAAALMHKGLQWVLSPAVLGGHIMKVSVLVLQQTREVLRQVLAAGWGMKQVCLRRSATLGGGEKVQLPSLAHQRRA